MNKARCGPAAHSSSLTGWRRVIPPGDEGQTTTEYAVVLSVVVIALAAVMFAREGPISSLINKVADEIAALLP